MAFTIAEINEAAYQRLEKIYNESNEFEMFVEDRLRDTWHAFEFNYSDDNLRIDSGASRGVLIFDDFDWVIKLGFDDMAEEKGYDFNEAEDDNYKEAVAHGLQEFFAKTWCAGDFHGVHFYLMEKADTNPNIISDNFYSGVYESDKVYSDYEEASGMYDDDVAGIANFFGVYASTEKVLEILEFCTCQYISDIHEANVGFINDHPVFIDYAGF